MEKKKLAFILGIRPDVIRAALVINQLRKYDDMEMVFIWSGQHYSDNLKSIFFRELDRKSTRLNSSHLVISYAVFCLKKKKTNTTLATTARPQRLLRHPFLL